MDKKYLSHIALLQALGVILVIMGHILAPYVIRWFGYEIHNSSLNSFHRFIYSFHMPLFFFISGYLFAYKKHDEKKIYEEIKLRFKRLIIPFILIGIFIFIPTVVFITPLDLSINNLEAYYIDFLTLRYPGYLWFLPTLFMMLILYSILLKTPLKKHMVILTFIIFLIGQYTPSCPLPWSLYRSQFSRLIFVHMGYIYCKALSYDKSPILSYPRLKGGTFSKLYGILIISFIAKTLANDFVLEIRFFLDAVYKVTTLYTIALIISIFLPEFSKLKIINQISQNMMGIYLLHDPLIMTYRRVVSENIGQNPLYCVLIFTPTVLITALGINLLYKKILGIIKNILNQALKQHRA